jgi:DNA-binding NtrC family response regulator
METLNILLLDDERVFREEIREFLENEGFSINAAGRPSEAFAILEENAIDILILDLRLPEMDGFAVLEKVKNLYPDIEVIMITGHGDMDAVIQAMRMGAVEFFPKPFRLLDMKAAIQRTRRFIEVNQRLKEVNTSLSLISKDLKESVGYEIVGKSKSIHKVIDFMRRVAQADNTSVLITGASGTGKELVARGIHSLSSRKNAPFYAVNCSAVPESLFESEFFGHKKGTFTGAIDDKAGWFEIANGGTLFLDEIVEMQSGMQSKLLRVLEDRKVRRLGSSNDISVDVRIIAATNQNIQELISSNKFRNDLYYRLNSFEIFIPPLRERPEDIPHLMLYYAEVLSKKMNKKFSGFDDVVMQSALNYPFTGNVRELRNMVERALILSDGGKLTLKDFAFAGITPATYADPQLEENSTLDLEELEKRAILKALEQTAFKKTEAAALLNITRQSLDRRLEKHNLMF